MTNHPMFKELGVFWESGKYSKELLAARIFAVNFTLALREDIPLEITEFLLGLHPDCPDFKDNPYLTGREGDNISVRMAAAENTKHISVLERLINDSRASVVELAKERLAELKRKTV